MANLANNKRCFWLDDMNLEKISIGTEFPDHINVIIEISCGSNVKYEMDKDSGALVVDRFLHTPMFYPANYGFIPQTIGDDGDPLDALVLTRWKVAKQSVIKVRPIGVVLMEDEKGIDEKIICVPAKKLDKSYESVKDIDDLDKQIISEISHFFEHYKDLEDGKWVKISGFGNSQNAKEIITKHFQHYMKKIDR